MKSLSKGRRAGLVSAAVLMGFVSATLAGPRYNVAGVVSITSEGANAWRVEGTLGEVRNSSNDLHRLSCQVSRTETTSSAGTVTRSSSVICQARNTERSVICVSTSEAMANALNGASNDALIELHMVGASCKDIIVYESSGLIKKA
jgi:hypothetical protein